MGKQEIDYESLFDGYFDTTTIDTLETPINEKNWLISPPPSPPRNWKPATEGHISRTLPFFDLPPPKLEEGSEKPTFVVYEPKKETGNKNNIPKITSCDF